MNWDAIGAIGEIIGAIAVVVTLIYLAVQLKQNTSSVKANSYQGWVASNLQINVAMSNLAQSQIIGKGNEDSANLSEDTYTSFGMMNIALMQMAQSTDYLYRTGSIDKELWESEMNRAAGILAFPGVRQWWDAGGRTQLTPSFVKLIESTNPELSYWNWEPGKGFVGTSKYIADTENK